MLHKVISAFPACGKSTFYNKNSVYVNPNNKLKILDSDSSLFSWIYDENNKKTNVRDPEFPQNYINHIKEQLPLQDYIFVSSHKVVRDALRDNHIHFTLIYPDRSLKDEWLRRFKERGNDDKFIQFQGEHWDEFITEMENESFPNKIIITDTDGGMSNGIMG
jgi:hypothetical protein